MTLSISSSNKLAGWIGCRKYHWNTMTAFMWRLYRNRESGNLKNIVKVLFQCIQCFLKA